MFPGWGRYKITRVTYAIERAQIAGSVENNTERENRNCTSEFPRVSRELLRRNIH
jgi:hypothetical protein